MNAVATVLVVLIIGCVFIADNLIKKRARYRNEKWRCARCNVRLDATEIHNRIAIAGGGTQGSRPTYATVCDRCKARDRLVGRVVVIAVALLFVATIVLLRLLS
jgi:hypothetical protein